MLALSTDVLPEASRVEELTNLALLPDTHDEVAALGVWLSLLDLGRHYQGVAPHIASVRGHELAWVALLLREGPSHHPTQDEVTRTIAMVGGLRVGLTAPEAPLTIEDARRLLLPQQGVVRRRAGVA